MLYAPLSDQRAIDHDQLVETLLGAALWPKLAGQRLGQRREARAIGNSAAPLPLSFTNALLGHFGAL